MSNPTAYIGKMLEPSPFQQKEMKNRLTMAKAENPYSHQVKVEQTHMITENTKSHGCEPAKDQVVKRGRKGAKDHRGSNPSWMQNSETEAMSPGARTGGQRAWARSRVPCCFEFAFSASRDRAVEWITCSSLRPHKLTSCLPRGPRAEQTGRYNQIIQEHSIMVIIQCQAIEMTLGSQGRREYSIELDKNYEGRNVPG